MIMDSIILTTCIIFAIISLTYIVYLLEVRISNTSVDIKKLNMVKVKIGFMIIILVIISMIGTFNLSNTISKKSREFDIKILLQENIIKEWDYQYVIVDSTNNWVDRIFPELIKVQTKKELRMLQENKSLQFNDSLHVSIKQNENK